MSKLNKRKWTLVQHSAWSAKQDPTFQDTVEPAGLTTHQELGEVIDAGGRVFDSLSDAEDAADEVSQDSLDRALYPEQVCADRAPMRLNFHPLTLDGRHLFLPVADAN